ncbi:hypothetical protein GPECTOR_14g102 [Gonium pectorale]|uniref:Uncharacterized protein n=1 Tax=Gonium pectorale TaxID=33097 RepID=A0A150GNC6_GONPE|nr:hypothetical protein GPECTOR_14g102 [Gonium pectorale]|eukprot:KXZ50850.1 hypothetical protein GPECTOR_14g102 [Gonium pectorale]
MAFRIAWAQPGGCSVYIFDFESEFPDLGPRLAPKAASHRCRLEGLATGGGPLFKRSALLSDRLAAMHVARGILPFQFAQHSGAWWLAQALAASPNRVTNISAADVVFVDDSCYAAWSEAKAHHHGNWGSDEELYVDPDLFLDEAYGRLVRHPAFVVSGGATWVLYHSHPNVGATPSQACRPELLASLHFVVEPYVRIKCRGPLDRALMVPYASNLLLYPAYLGGGGAAASAGAGEGRVHTAAATAATAAEKRRETLVHFRATCVGDRPGKLLRRALASALGNASGCVVSCASMGWEQDMLQEMAASRFCLVPQGDSFSSRRAF